MTFRKGGCLNFSFAVWSVALLLLLTVAAPVFAQNAAGTILGVVKDAQGGAVAGATVSIRSTETGLTRSLTTGDDGAYRAPALPVGGYSVKIEKLGFKTSTHDGLVLTVTQEMDVNFELQIGQATQQVVVTGEAPLVETTTSSLGGLVTEEKIADLPLNGRNYIDLTLLQSGVARAASAGSITSRTTGVWFSSNGAPPRSNNITLDGARLNNQAGATSASQGGNTLGVDGIREYKVVTDMFSAEYGLGMGSQVTMVSKSGSNQWHGDAFEYLRNEKLDARNYFDYGFTVPGSTQRLPPYKRNNFGGAFGGPIKKDKTFLFVAYEGLREHLSPTIYGTTFSSDCYSTTLLDPNTGLPALDTGSPRRGRCRTGPPGNPLRTTWWDAGGPNPMEAILNLFPRPNAPCGVEPSATAIHCYTYPALTRNGENYGQIRFDQNMSSADSFFVRYTTTQYNALNDGNLPAPDPAKLNSPMDQFVNNARNHFATVSESHIFGPELLNTTRISFSRTTGYSTIQIANGPTGCPSLITGGPGCLATAQYSLVPGRSLGNFIVPGLPNPTPGAGANTGNTIQNIYTLSDDVFYTKGRHALKFGILFNRFNEGLVGALGGNSSNGEFQGNPLGSGAEYSSTGYAFYDYRGLAPDASSNFVFNTLGFYAQDDVRATSRLTLNLGLRYEFNTTPHEVSGKDYTYLNLLDPTVTQASATVNEGGLPGVTGFTKGPIMHNASLKNFSPRVGFAWDVFGNGKTSLRGGFGEFFDVGNIGSAVAQSVFAQSPLTSYYVVTATGSSATPDCPLGTPPTLAGPGTTGCPIAPLTIPFTSPANLTPSQPHLWQALHTLDHNSGQPHLLQYNLGIQRELPGGVAVNIAYVGSRGIDLFRLIDENPNKTIAPSDPRYATACLYHYNTTDPCWGNDPGAPQGRLNPNFGPTYMVTTGADSWYNSLQFNVNTHVSHGFQAQASYTYSKTMDTGEGQTYVFDCFSNGGGGQALDPTASTRTDRGPACFDVTHNLRMNFLYRFPNVKSNGFASKVLNGWWMGNIVSLQSGYPFLLNTTALFSNSGAFGADFGEKPNIVTKDNLAAALEANPNAVLYDHSKLILGQVNNWFNANMYTLAGQTQPAGACSLGNNNPCSFGFVGDEPRNDMRGPKLKNWDLSINKDTKLGFLGENGSLQFRAELFNVLNHANFALPEQNDFAGNAGWDEVASGPGVLLPGTIQHTAGASRQIQLALKLVF